MKKILIAGFFAGIMLLVPFSSISGGSVIGNNTTVEDRAVAYPVIPDYLLEGLIDKINFLLANYGHIPEIVEFCNEALEVFNSGNVGPVVICIMLGALCIEIQRLAEYYWDKAEEAQENGQFILSEFYFLIVGRFLGIGLDVYDYGASLGCWDPILHGLSIIEIETGLNQQTTQQSITGLIPTNEVNLCPCSSQR